jgi:hypothetical protein
MRIGFSNQRYGLGRSPPQSRPSGPQVGRLRKEDRAAAAGCASLYSHPAAPAGDEADDPDAVLVSPRLAANKAGESPAQHSCAASKGPQRAALDGVGPRTPREHRRTEEQARPLARATEQRKPNHDPEGWEQCRRSPATRHGPEVRKPRSRLRLTPKPREPARVQVQPGPGPARPAPPSRDGDRDLDC